ncbi:circularly permuted type 2 ATP-grasp protein [Actibacterium sp.]|uniref:circularly permuted type 2 ATP-grasp protein n=1 Tax=Actibacterium sp. TaxID=1872125 RepID=UPI003567D387
MTADGRVRPVWRAFMDRLAQIKPEEMVLRMSRGDQYLRDAGVFYRRYEENEASTRDWPLSHMPVLIDHAEWEEIAAGLGERADLLEAVLRDVYGENTLVDQGLLPAALIGANSEWLRPLVGVEPASGHFLHFLAFDIGRGPRGDWWVLGDRTQAPSGAGFALENRMATSRVYSGLYDNTDVTRLAGFFRMFRDSLMDLRGDDNSRVGILTPGPLNDTYFEHAYIARYLGFMLLEGEDLAVDKGQLMVRTVNGLQPVSVLWRRLDASWTDPLELNEGSRLGTPGLLRAVRNGNVTMVNALGAGIMETRALLAFMPRLSQALHDRPLRIPNIATWWCGGSEERNHVARFADTMTLSRAFSTAPEADHDDTAFADLSAPELAQLLESRGSELVAQERVRLSTAPAFVNGRLQPRPMSLRVFLARTEQGWAVMPGGFARIGGGHHPDRLSMQSGGQVADVWVVGGNTSDAETMLPKGTGRFTRKQQTALPSRAADNLYWLGRYVERSEHLMRVLRAYHARLAESADDDAPLLKMMRSYLARYGVDTAKPPQAALLPNLNAANACAGQVSDRFSVDGSAALAALRQAVSALPADLNSGDDTARALSTLLHQISGFSGLVHDNMYRFTGWRFLSLGRAIERAGNGGHSLAEFLAPKKPYGALDLILEIGDSAMTHRRRYSVGTNRASIVDLLLLDNQNPRAFSYQIDLIKEHLKRMPGAETSGRLSPLRRDVLRLHTDLALLTAEAVDHRLLSGLSGRVDALSDHLTQTFLR